jgi:hypothetical protein
MDVLREREWGAEAVSITTSGLNGHIPGYLDAATANITVAVFIQISANSLEN